MEADLKVVDSWVVGLMEVVPLVADPSVVGL